MSDSNSGPNPITCGIIEELLPGYADGDLNPGALEMVRSHLEACDLCSNRFRRISGSSGSVSKETEGLETAATAPGVAGGRSRQSADAGLPWKPVLLGIGLVSLGALAGAAGTLMVDGGPRGGVVATLAPVGDDAVHHRGFSLERPMDLRVYALGEGIDGEMYDYAWIVDASSRTPVWAMRFGDTQHAGGASKNRMVDQVVSMNAGDYILYYVSDGSHSSQSWNSSPPSNPDHWGVTLLTVGERDGRAVKPYDPRADDRIIAQLVGATDDDHLRQRFALDRETEVRVYAIGEGIGNEMYDYAWIEDGDSRRVVWEMRYQHTDNAGGAEKNRVVNGTLRLPAGEYVLHYATDDSHSFNDWNEAPPVDAFNYGVTLFKTER